MEKEGCFTGFVLDLVGGFFWLVLGIGLIFRVLFRVWEVKAIGDELTRGFIIGNLAVALYILIISVWIVNAAFWMKKQDELKKGAWTSLILGIISINVLAIVAGAIGLSKLRKGPLTVKLASTTQTKPTKIIEKPFPDLKKPDEKPTKPLEKLALKPGVKELPTTKEKVPSKPVVKPITREISSEKSITPSVKTATTAPLTKPVPKPTPKLKNPARKIIKRTVKRHIRKPIKKARKK